MVAMTMFILSIGIQLFAAAYALVLIRITGWKMAWIFMSIAMVLMASRRVVTFISFVAEGKPIRFDVPEIIALSISCLMLLGVLNIRALFRSIYAADAERKAAEQKIGKLNAELLLKIRQIEAAQEALINKEKLSLLGQMAGSVGHELRNPLGVMSNAVYLLQTVLPGADATTREYLNIIKNEVAVSERIVSDLLDSVRTKPPHPQVVEVRELLEQALRKCIVPASVTVKLNILPNLSPLLVDTMQIQQVFRNLISNGVEAMPAGGMLEIGAVENKSDRSVTVSVRDDGVGMTEEQMGKLFQPLSTTKARGIGLGLMVVKNLTLANSGSVGVKSDIGKGSVFTVKLPCAALQVG